MSLLTLSWSAFAMASDRTEPLIIDALVQPEAPYIQQQVTYTLRLWRQSHLQRGYFLTPDIPDALVIPAPPTRQRSVTRNAQEYELLQQTYFIFPQRSGKIRLPAPIFSSRDLFIKGKPLILRVKPAVNAEKVQPWVIAERIMMEQQWQLPGQSIQIGQPIERSLIIHAQGITGAQLPRPVVPPVKDMRIQRLAPQTRYEIKDGQVLGTRIERLRYIPEQAGEYQLTDIHIRWWNSHSDTAATTLLHGLKIHVNPQATGPTHPDARNAAQSNLIAAEQTILTSSLATRSAFWMLSSPRWILLFLVIIFVCFLLWKYSVYSRWVNYIQLYLLRRKVLTACSQNDPAGLKDSLLKWAQLKFHTDQLNTLLSLTVFIHDKNVHYTLSILDRSLYGEYQRPCSVQQLKQLFSSLRSSTISEKDKKDHCLPDLWSVT